MNLKDLFDSNSYTSKAMPISTSLCRMLDEELDAVSDEIKACRDKYESINQAFYDSLSEQQCKLFDMYHNIESEEYNIGTQEHFNMGMRFGAMLMKELLS